MTNIFSTGDKVYTCSIHNYTSLNEPCPACCSIPELDRRIHTVSSPEKEKIRELISGYNGVINSNKEKLKDLDHRHQFEIEKLITENETLKRVVIDLKKILGE